MAHGRDTLWRRRPPSQTRARPVKYDVDVDGKRSGWETSRTCEESICRGESTHLSAARASGTERSE
eukprot:8479436-Pyramimonas_sp.AAC.1